MNLVSEIVEALGPTIMSRVASSLGFDQAVTQKAVNAAVPGLLAALISLVSKPQGANKLADAVGKQPAGILSSLADAIGGSGEKALMDKSSNTLTSLLGGPVVSSLTSALGRYAGRGLKELAWPSWTRGPGGPCTPATRSRVGCLGARQASHIPERQCRHRLTIWIFQVSGRSWHP